MCGKSEGKGNDRERRETGGARERRGRGGEREKRTKSLIPFLICARMVGHIEHHIFKIIPSSMRHIPVGDFHCFLEIIAPKPIYICSRSAFNVKLSMERERRREGLP